MQTYSFDQLDERGQASAIQSYHLMPEVTETRANDPYLSLDSAFHLLGMRFTEHGERIA